MSSLPPAVQLLTGVLHPDLAVDDARRRWSGSAPNQRSDAVRLAGAAGIAAYTAWRLGDSDDTELSSADLLHAATRDAASTHALYMELGGLLDALRSRNIPALLLKGADLGSRAYPRSELRPMTDVDVLVAPDNRDRAEHALAELGFVRDRNEAVHHLRLSRRGPPRVSVEVHTELFDRPHGLRIRADELWSRAAHIKTSIEGVSAQVLGPVDALVHIAAHATWSDTLATPTAALRGALDLVLLARAAAPQEEESGTLAGAFWERAREWRLSVAVDAAVDIASELFPGALRAIETARPGRRRGPRARLAHAALRANARRALTGDREAARFSPRATTTRSMMAPTLPGALWMLTAGAARALRRRR